ncbi:MAG: hypothetical protein D6689_08365 [Deltaproteobacteria bacterium]|nr:MAG: hypothetical protein D6689_08365 [Deltaproteobacteria bacterium]
MKTLQQLEAMWSAAPAAPRDRGTVELICVRVDRGVHRAPDAVEVTADDGVVGDRWSLAGDPARNYQITLINAAVARFVAHAGAPAIDVGDNFHVNFDLSAEALPPGARLRLGGAVVEVTPEPHTGCSTFRSRFGVDALAWVNGKPRRHLRLRGVNVRVIDPGRVCIGDVVERVC